MDMKKVGERIKYLREQKKLNRNQLANSAGVSPTYIYQLEKGEKSPTVEYLGHICFGLNITLKDFFNFEHPDCNDPVSSLTEKQRKILNDFLTSYKQ